MHNSFVVFYFVFVLLLSSDVSRKRVFRLYIWIVSLLESDFSVWPVPGIDTGIFRQSKQLVPDALAQDFTVPAGEIRSSNAAIEQSVADKYGFFCSAVKTNAPGGMSGSIQDG